MNRHSLTIAALVFAFLGIADSWYLASSALTNTALTCNIKGFSGCNVVEQSAYSHLFGLPLGVYGVGFYVLFFILAAFLFHTRSRIVYLALFVLGWIGLIGSLIFEGIQIFIIHALCVYCLGSAIIALILCILAAVLWKRFAPPRTGASSASSAPPTASAPPVPPAPSA